MEALAPAAYTDLHRLESLKAKIPEGGSGRAQLEEAAAAFESLFLDLWLKSMREAGAVFSEGSYLTSDRTEFHQEMLDHQWAVEMSGAGGLGLRDVIVRQLAGGMPDEEEAGAAGLTLPQRSRLPGKDAVQPLPEPDTAPTPAAAAKQAHFDDPGAFVAELLPAVRAGLQGSPLNPLVVLAQAALETGWGRAVMERAPGESSHNLFGIKAREDAAPAESVAAQTREYLGGRFVSRIERFRAYPDWESAVRDYAGLVMNSPRYQEAVAAAKDPAAYADGLQKGGYATDPEYAAKILRVLQQIERLVL